MDAGRRAAAGAGLVGLAFAADAALALPRFGFGLLEASLGLIALGFLVAAAGFAGLHEGHGHGLPALALGHALAAGAMVAFAAGLAGFEGASALGLFAAALLALGTVQAAWAALLAWAAPDQPLAPRAAGLRIGAATGAAGSLLLGWASTEGGDLTFLGPALLGAAGFALVAASRGLLGPGPVAGEPARGASEAEP